MSPHQQICAETDRGRGRPLTLVYPPSTPAPIGGAPEAANFTADPPVGVFSVIL